MYRGKPVINIRTFFRDRGDAPGVMRPSQKGIALQMDQWDLIKEMIPMIDTEIEAIRDNSNRQRNLEDENAELRRKLAAMEIKQRRRRLGSRLGRRRRAEGRIKLRKSLGSPRWGCTSYGEYKSLIFFHTILSY